MVEGGRARGDVCLVKGKRQRRFAFHIVEDEHSFIGDDWQVCACVGEGKRIGRVQFWQVGQARHLVSDAFQTAFFECVDRRAAVGNNGSDLVEDQVEERFQFEGRGDALGNIQHSGEFARAVSHGLLKIAAGLYAFGHIRGDDEEAVAVFGLDAGVVFADTARFAVGAADPVLQFRGEFGLQDCVHAFGFLGECKVADALPQVAFGTFAENFAGAVVDVDQFAVFDDGQPLLDVIGQVAEAFLAEAGGVLGLLVHGHLQGQFQIQARQFVLVGVGALFEFAVELQEVGFEVGGGGSPLIGNRGQPQVQKETERGGENPQSPRQDKRCPAVERW